MHQVSIRGFRRGPLPVYFEQLEPRRLFAAAGAVAGWLQVDGLTAASHAGPAASRAVIDIQGESIDSTLRSGLGQRLLLGRFTGSHLQYLDPAAMRASVHISDEQSSLGYGTQFDADIVRVSPTQWDVYASPQVPFTGHARISVSISRASADMAPYDRLAQALGRPIGEFEMHFYTARTTQIEMGLIRGWGSGYISLEEGVPYPHELVQLSAAAGLSAADFDFNITIWSKDGTEQLIRGVVQETPFSDNTGVTWRVYAPTPYDPAVAPNYLRLEVIRKADGLSVGLSNSLMGVRPAIRKDYGYGESEPKLSVRLGEPFELVLHEFTSDAWSRYDNGSFAVTNIEIPAAAGGAGDAIENVAGLVRKGRFGGFELVLTGTVRQMPRYLANIRATVVETHRAPDGSIDRFTGDFNYWSTITVESPVRLRAPETAPSIPDIGAPARVSLARLDVDASIDPASLRLELQFPDTSRRYPAQLMVDEAGEYHVVADLPGFRRGGYFGVEVLASDATGLLLARTQSAIQVGPPRAEPVGGFPMIQPVLTPVLPTQPPAAPDPIASDPTGSDPETPRVPTAVRSTPVRPSPFNTRIDIGLASETDLFPTDEDDLASMLG